MQMLTMMMPALEGWEAVLQSLQLDELFANPPNEWQMTMILWIMIKKNSCVPFFVNVCKCM